jgi:hypothetical protein
MDSAADFLREARAAYLEVNRKMLEWMLARPLLRGAFVNTKQNSITLRDYDNADGWRGPDILYGWIQGRGLEALVRHAQFFEDVDPNLSRNLTAAAQSLFHVLTSLYARERHAYFTYDGELKPITPDAGGRPVPQAPAGDLFSYSDIFVAKGLAAASAQFDPEATKGYLRDIAAIVEAVEQGRFMIDERRSFAAGAPSSDADEYGPRMILLSASALLRDLGFHEEAAFSDRFVRRIIARHLDRDAHSRSYGLLRDRPNGEGCNPGHAIEFVGLALECDATRNDGKLLQAFDLILKASFKAGFRGPGLVLRISITTLEPQGDLCPWWSLPEAMRAAALLYLRTRDPEVLDVWRQMHEAFFNNYWREDASLAYQTRSAFGPVDHVPATPDLDPAYHTGLSFLSAIRVIDQLLAD